jgi:hypothetical protein
MEAVMAVPVRNVDDTLALSSLPEHEEQIVEIDHAS